MSIDELDMIDHREIIELANIIAERPCDSKDCAPCIRMGRRCNDYLNAERAIKAGYRKQSEAEWIPIIDEPTPLRECVILSGYECSECGRYEKEKQPYCNCGAKMKGV